MGGVSPVLVGKSFFRRIRKSMQQKTLRLGKEVEDGAGWRWFALVGNG
jgi:hypothetical protein